MGAEEEGPRRVRKAGAIYYHSLAGFGRPFVIRKVTDTGCDLYNLDDGGVVFLNHEQMDAFELQP